MGSHPSLQKDELAAFDLLNRKPRFQPRLYDSVFRKFLRDLLHHLGRILMKSIELRLNLPVPVRQSVSAETGCRYGNCDEKKLLLHMNNHPVDPTEHRPCQERLTCP